MNESPLKIKSFMLAKEGVQLYNFLKEEKGEYTMSKQLLRSGTNSGAMIR